MSPRDRPADRALRVDPIRCSAHGMCAEILPERVRLDDWGYPMLDGEPLTPELLGLARRAVAACPRTALALTAAPRRVTEATAPRSR